MVSQSEAENSLREGALRILRFTGVRVPRRWSRLLAGAWPSPLPRGGCKARLGFENEIFDFRMHAGRLVEIASRRATGALQACVPLEALVRGQKTCDPRLASE